MDAAGHQRPFLVLVLAGVGLSSEALSPRRPVWSSRVWCGLARVALGLVCSVGRARSGLVGSRFADWVGYLWTDGTVMIRRCAAILCKQGPALKLNTSDPRLGMERS